MRVNNMLNILRMDLHRFRTNKMMYLLLLLYGAFQVFGIFMMKQYEQPIEDGELKLGLMNESEFIQLMLSQTPSWVMIYIAVFSIYFYMSEYSSGFYKNYITMKSARIHSVISKIFIQALFTLSIFIVMVIADLIGRGIFFDTTAIGDWGYFAKLLAGQFLLHWSFSILILCVAMVARSMLVSLCIGFIFALNVIGMVLGALESLVDQVRLSKFLLVNTIVSSTDYNNAHNLLHVGGVAILSLLLFTAIAVNYKLKEDLR